MRRRNGMVVHRGIGFPSCSRELDVRPVNTRDPGGYYAWLGLSPWATEAEIKERCRFLLRAYHPDGRAPDRELFERVEMMYRTLTDPVKKAEYDNTPEGTVPLDREVLEEMSRHMTPEQIKERVEQLAPSHVWTHAYERGYPPTEDEVDFWCRLVARVGWELGLRGPVQIEFCAGAVGKATPGWVRIDHTRPPSTGLAVDAVQAALKTGFLSEACVSVNT
jgi:hypothetical protein